MSAPSSAVATTVVQRQWSPQQKCFRHLLVALREAYYHDRAKLFWARHRVRVEFYKYSEMADGEAIKNVVAITDEAAAFIKQHMQFSVQRIVDHNATLARLPVEEAKRFQQRFKQREEEHESWCKGRLKLILRRRPQPPYPFC